MSTKKENRAGRRSEIGSLCATLALLWMGAAFNNLQSQQVGCSASLAPPASVTFGYLGTVAYPTNSGAYFFSVYTGNTCSWIASSYETWIKLLLSSGTGNGVFGVGTEANLTSTARSGIVTVASSGGSAQLTVNQLSANTPPPSFTITTGSLPSGTVGEPYAGATLDAANGKQPYSWSVSSGSLPLGFTLSNGYISGTPIIAGISNFKIQAIDSSSPSQTATQTFTLAVYAGNSSPSRVITTFAGTDWVFPSVPRPASDSPLGSISGMALDAQGNLLVADPDNNMVFRISPGGTLSALAGNGIAGFSGDGGRAIDASLNKPLAVAQDKAGNIYIADSVNSRIRRVSSDGFISTFAGSTMIPFGGEYSGDGGPAISATLLRPSSLALDAIGNFYIGDPQDGGSSVIRRVDPGGVITTFAGVPNVDGHSTGWAIDGKPANQSYIQNLEDIAVDASGNLYVVEAPPDFRGNGSVIRKVGSDGTFQTIVGSGTLGSSPNGGVATSLKLGQNANGVVVDAAGVIYFSDTSNHSVFRVTKDGNAQRLVGTGVAGYSGDSGAGITATLNSPGRLALSSQGDLYLADSGNQRVRRMGLDGLVRFVAGNGSYHSSVDGVPSGSANLNSPNGLAIGPDGSLYISETNGNRVTRVTPNNISSTVAGSGAPGYGGDNGPADKALLLRPAGLTFDQSGNLYITDQGNARIRKVTPDGTITTAAGNGVSDYTNDGGPAVNAALEFPTDVATDLSGNLYIAAQFIRKVAPDGSISTVIGSGIGFGGDGGPAAKALLNLPWGVATDIAGNIYVAEMNNGRIRLISSSGTITTFAGHGDYSSYGDGGPATGAGLFRVRGVRADNHGNIYIVQDYGYAVRIVTPDGIIHTLAGNGSPGNDGDGGPATAAHLGFPTAVAIDKQGQVYIADSENNRIRVVLVTPPTVQVSTNTLIFTGQSTGAPSAKQSFSITSVPGLGFSLTVATANGGNWLTVTPQSGAAPRLVDVIADPSKVSSKGTYQGTIKIATPNANPVTTTINVTFTVTDSQPPALAPLDPRNITFSFAKTTPAQTQSITISNSGGGTLNFTAAAVMATPSGATPLTLSQTSGQATPDVPAVLLVTADPTGLGAGTFSGTVLVSARGTTLSIPVTITVSVLDQAIQLSQRGLFFSAVEQGGVIPPQTFAVRNIGSGSVSWTAKTVPPSPINGIVSTVPWLSVSPSSGTTDAARNPPTVTVSVDVSRLLEGTYYSLIEVDAPIAANSPQLLTVVVQVLKAGAPTGAVLAPGSLLFTTSAGQSSPSSQNVLVYNVSANAKSFRSAVSTDFGLKLVTLPTDATLDPQNPTSIVVQPFTDGLAPGVYTGVVTMQFDDGRILRLTVKVIVTDPARTSSSLSRGGTRSLGSVDAQCNPKKLQPILTAPNENFQGFTGFGLKLGVFVKDDCGAPLESGTVTVTFSNGDQTATLTSLQGGLWEGNWYTRNPSPNVNLTLAATNPQGVSGTLTTNGSLAMQQPPVFDNTGIFGAFGGRSSAPLAPGEIISIYGSGLAETTLEATGAPLLSTLADTQVTIGLRPFPLYYISDKQVNAVVPYSLNQSLNAPLQIVVQRGTTLSQPVDVTVAVAAPVIFSGDNGVTSYPAGGGPPYTVSPDKPAHAGDIVVFYCVGLGAVDPPVADGGVPVGLSSSAPVQMTIGDQAATVAFQGLTQFPGLYQVNAQVPASAPKGASVPVTISLGGQTSPPILIPIQ